MNLNENAWHARLFRLIYSQHRLPDNFCNYFWTIVVLLLTMPIYFPGLLLAMSSKLRSKHDFRGPAVTVVGFLINVFIALNITMVMKVMEETGLSVTLSTIIVPIIITTGMAVFYYGIYLFSEALPEKAQSNDNIVGMTSEYFKAKKEAYCPKIEWEKDEDSKRDNTD